MTCDMAFFGLTQLGPQSQFHAVLMDAMDITLFTEEEFRRAFARLDKDRSGFIEIGEVRCSASAPRTRVCASVARACLLHAFMAGVDGVRAGVGCVPPKSCRIVTADGARLGVV